jgi:uncharacterized protein YceK
MKHLLLSLVVLLLLVWLFAGCASIREYARPVCDVAADACRYQSQVCAMLNDSTYTRAQIDSVARLAVDRATELRNMAGEK